MAIMMISVVVNSILQPQTKSKGFWRIARQKIRSCALIVETEAKSGPEIRVEQVAAGWAV